MSDSVWLEISNGFWRFTFTPAMKRTLYVLKRILFGLIILLVVILIAGFIVVRYYEDEVVSYALTKIEERLNTKMNVQSADLTLWESFPMASVKLSDVYIEETFAEKDTLVFAREVMFKFSLSDLFTGNYSIREIGTSDAMAHLKINEKGKDNWHFWKSDTTDTARFSLNLESVQLSQLNLIYEDRKSRFFMDVTADDANAEGNFGSDKFEMKIDMLGKVGSLISGETEYAQESQIEINSSLLVDNNKQQVVFTETELILDQLPMNVSGNVKYEDQSILDLSIDLEKVDLSRVVSRLPIRIQEQLRAYGVSGKVSMEASIKGESSKTKNPVFDGQFTIADGQFTHNESGVELSNINCQARYSNVQGKSDQLSIDELSAEMGGGSLLLNGNIENLSSPEVYINLQSRLDLDQLRQFFTWDTLEVCTGTLSADATISGKLIQATDTTFDWKGLTASGNARLTDANLKIRSDNLQFLNISGGFVLDGNRATVENLTSDINGNQVSLHGSLNNLINYIFTDTARLSIDARAESPALDFGNWIETEEHTNRNSDYHFSLPERIDMNLNTTIERFTFREFTADNIKGVIKLERQFLTIDPVSFKTADGDFMSRLSFEQESDNYFMMRCSANINKIDISKFFDEFGAFGQEFITGKNLKGIATANIQFSAQVSTSLKIQSESIESLVDIRIENGRLVGLNSLQQIAEYLRKNKWVAPFVDEDRFAEKLKDVKFSKLENVIEIKNKTITIPVMDIRTSAMDITARGTHSFDNHINYTIGFYLRDILVKKEKELQEEDDRLGKQMFIYMRGTTTSPEFGLDKEASKENRQQEMEQEKQNVKSLLKEEFGLFRKDNTIGPYKEESKPGSSLSIEWDELDNKTEEEPLAPVKKDPPKKTEPVETPKKKVPKWLEEKDDVEKDE